MNTLLKKLSLIIIALSFSASALALTLQEAKGQALVGEMPTGYLGAIKQSEEISQLVKTVNAKRKQLYIKIARKNKLKLDQVAARAGERNLKKTKAGHMVKNAAGNWVKK